MNEEMILDLIGQMETEDYVDLDVICQSQVPQPLKKDVTVQTDFEGITIEGQTDVTYQKEVVLKADDVKIIKEENIEWSCEVDTYVKAITGSKGVSSNAYKDIRTEIPDRWDSVAIQIPKEIILIDFDSEVEGEKFIEILKRKGCYEKTRILKTTKGYHFYFKHNQYSFGYKDWVNSYTTVGMVCDVKNGRNTKNFKTTGEEHPSYAIIKKDGVVRKWINDLPFTDCEPLPFWFVPTPSNNKVTHTSLVGMNEGDGRQQALFEHIGKLICKGVDRERILIGCEIINDMVFAEPLPENEYQNATRDDAFNGAEQFSQQVNDMVIPSREILIQNGYRVKDGKKTVLAVSELGHDVCESFRFVNDMGNIYRFDGYKYIETKVDDVNSMIRQMIITNKKLTMNETKEVIFDILTAQNMNVPDGMYFKVKRSPELIALDNGYLNPKTMEIVPKDESLFVNKGLNGVVYDSQITSYEPVETMLKNVFLGDEKMIDCFWEWVGYTLLPSQPLNKCMLFTGSGSNGKTTVLDMLSEFYGTENISTVAFTDIGKQFKLSGIENSLVNIDADVSVDSKIDDGGGATFKKMTGRDAVQIERKFQDPVSHRISAKFMFACNGYPKSVDQSKGFYRRWIVLPFDANFSKANPDIKFDPFIGEKVKTADAKSYILNMALKGLKRLLENNEFSTSDRMVTALNQMRISNDNVIEWISMEDYKRDFFLYKPQIVDKNAENPTDKENLPNLLGAIENADQPQHLGIVDNYYQEYENWCTCSKCKPVKKSNFMSRICQYYNLETKRVQNQITGGKKTYVFYES